MSEFVQSMVIPEPMARNICEAEVNESYLEYLDVLNRRTEFTQALRKGEIGKGVVPISVNEVEPQVLKLKQKAISRVREFLLQRIHALKKPRTNLQMIQHNVLSKFKYMNVFLQAHAPQVYDEVQALYVDTLSKLYNSHFKAYISGKKEKEGGKGVVVVAHCSFKGLTRLENVVATKYDLLGTEPEKLKSWTDKFSSSRSGGNVFALGNRDQLLSNAGIVDLLILQPSSSHVFAKMLMHWFRMKLKKRV